MKTDSGGRDYKSKYTEKSITGRKADREYKAQPNIAAGISGRGGPVTVLERLCTVFVQFLFGAVLLFLIAISATMTCSVYGGEEKVHYGPDQPVVHILLLIVFLAAGVWFYRKRRIGADRFSLTARQYRRLIIAVAGFYLIWLLITMYWPNSDQRMAMESARSQIGRAHV